MLPHYFWEVNGSNVFANYTRQDLNVVSYLTKTNCVLSYSWRSRQSWSEE